VLADGRQRKIELGASEMLFLESIRKRFVKERPLKGLRNCRFLHVTERNRKPDDRRCVDGGADAVPLRVEPPSTQDESPLR